MSYFLSHNRFSDYCQAMSVLLCCIRVTLATAATFYSLPVLKDILPSDYFFHRSLLVASLYLLGTNISSDDIDCATHTHLL